MDWNTASRNWPALSEAILTRWPELDREDVSAIDGDRTSLNVLIGQVMGLTPREASEEIDAFLAGPFPADAIMDRTQDNRQVAASAAHVPPGEDVYSEDADFGDDCVAERPLGRKLGS